MNCEQAEQFLSQQLEVLLTADEAGRMESHLQQCTACRRLQEELLALRSRLRAVARQRPELDSDRRAIDLWLAERGVAGTASRRGVLSSSVIPRSAVARLAPLSAAAAAMLLVLLGVMLVRD